MNYVYMFLEIIFTFFLMFSFYKVGKKNGLYLFMVLMSCILSVVMFKVIDLFSFQVNLGIPIIMSLFICNNIIIQRFGIDEVKRIMASVSISYIATIVILSLITVSDSSSYYLVSNEAFDGLFGYGSENIRVILGGSFIILMLWINSYIYYYIRRSKNILWFSTVGSSLIIQMLESIIFVLVSYLGKLDFTLIFGMIVIRYLIKIIISFMGVAPVYLITKMKDK